MYYKIHIWTKRDLLDLICLCLKVIVLSGSICPASWRNMESSHGCLRRHIQLRLEDVYTRKPTSGSKEKNQGKWSLVDLNRGTEKPTQCHVTISSNLLIIYSSSDELGQQLLNMNVTMVGTVQKNKSELPSALLASKARGFLIKVCLHTHQPSSFLPPKDKILWYLWPQRLKLVIARTGSESSS